MIDSPTPEALRTQYESGATVDELAAASGLSYGTVLNRLHEAGTEMRTSWQTRRMRNDPQARRPPPQAGHVDGRRRVLTGAVTAMIVLGLCLFRRESVAVVIAG
ncbi:helix-turn-helix domain-containing protein [Streptomyces lacrimifluminis]|uniref:helix-turn-helix domain-containing protein n=1 Tax=Streptomyces lacrimifluminis TaxID=1500077 RepID=UPI001E2D591D|nr:hypothetical protein [Streptomyces lacrimifluminis]